MEEKTTQGGKRPGAGRKNSGETAKIPISFRLDADVVKIIKQQPSQTEFIETAIRKAVILAENEMNMNPTFLVTKKGDALLLMHLSYPRFEMTYIKSGETWQGENPTFKEEHHLSAMELAKLMREAGDYIAEHKWIVEE